MHNPIIQCAMQNTWFRGNTSFIYEWNYVRILHQTGLL